MVGGNNYKYLFSLLYEMKETSGYAVMKLRMKRMVPCISAPLVRFFFCHKTKEMVLMIDTHYDLLTIAYIAYLKNDYSYLEKISHYFNENNVIGVFANLYFMSKMEMFEELHPKYYQENISVLEMFKISKKIIDSYLPDTDILYSIEGADLIKGPLELEQLYDQGLDSLILTWNTKSKYGSGNRSNQGLTIKGEELLKKAISLGMGIDLSHANEKTFEGMIRIIKEEQRKGINVCTYASHSNSRSLCNRNRNLTDQQLREIKNVNGLVGVFSNRNFLVEDEVKDKVSTQEKEIAYLKHIEHISKIMGKDNTMLATDDMDFCKEVDQEYGEVQLFDYSSLSRKVYHVLESQYDQDTIFQMMYQNAKDKVLNKIRKAKGKGEKR